MPSPPFDTLETRLVRIEAMLRNIMIHLKDISEHLDVQFADIDTILIEVKDIGVDVEAMKP